MSNQNKKIMAQKGFDIKKEISINVSADQLWEMVGPGFVEVYKWSSNVDFAQGSGTPEFDGAVCSDRECNVNVKGFDKISEKLIKYNAKDKVLAYCVVGGMPGFVERAVNEWTVVADGPRRSRLQMSAQFRSKGLVSILMNPLMKKNMSSTLETVLNDAKIYAETGQVSEAKRMRIEELKRKKSPLAA